MKTLILLLVLSTSLGAQSIPIGQIITTKGEDISLFGIQEGQKVMFSKKDKGCECKFKKGKILFFDEEGQVQKINESQIQTLTLFKNAVMCKEVKRSSSTNTNYGHVVKTTQIHNTIDNSFQHKVINEKVYKGLPKKQNGSKIVLQTVIASNGNYMLALYFDKKGGGFLSVYDSNNQLVDAGGYSSMTLGLKKRGKKGLELIKKHFSDCPAVMKSIEKTEKRNAKAKKRFRIPYLYGARSFKCE